jgi:hypothetical protein
VGSGGVVELWNWGSRKVESASFKLESRGTFALCLLQVNYFSDVIIFGNIYVAHDNLLYIHTY